VFEVDARAALVRVTGEFGMPIRKTRKLDTVTDLTLLLGKVSDVKILSVMFLMAGRARQLAGPHPIHICNRGAGLQEKRRLGFLCFGSRRKGGERGSRRAVRRKGFWAECVTFQAELAVVRGALLQKTTYSERA